jgi:hypothetical protein
MLSEAGTGLVRADRSIAEAERNVQALEALIPQIAARGYSTTQVEEQIEVLTQMLTYLKSQRWEIEGMLGAP